MDMPRAWVYLRDGRSLSIEADRGVATTPDGGASSRPEDAVLEGAVVVRMYAAVAGANRPVDGAAEPLVTMRTTRLRVDAVRGELEIPERFALDTAGLAFTGRGLMLLYNEPESRADLLRIAERYSCTYRPRSLTPGLPPGPARADNASRQATLPAGTTSTPAPPREDAGRTTAPARPAEVAGHTIYHATFPSGVEVRQSGRALAADRAEAWVRLIGHALPEGAIAPVVVEVEPRAAGSTPPTRPTTPESPTGARPDERHAGAAPATTPLLPTGNEPVEIVWAGPLDVVPVQGEVAELARNDVHLRFTSDRDGGVTITDPAGHVHATGRRLDYGATRREASLRGATGEAATIARAGTGAVTAERIDASLGTGVVRVPVAGTLNADEAGRESPRGVTWSREAEFRMAMRDGAVTNQVREIRMTGDVRARDAAGTLGANTVTATFADAAGDTTLSRILAIGAARAADREGGEVSGDTIDAAFQPRDGRPALTHATITGNAVAGKDGRVVRAESLDAVCVPSNTGVRVDRVEARGAARFDGEDDQHAQAETIIAWPDTHVAHLSGEHSKVWRGPSSVEGHRIILDGTNRTLDVIGEGTIRHTAQRNSAAEMTTVSWTHGLRYDDVAESGACTGSVLAITRRGEHDSETLSADTATLDLATVVRADGTSVKELVTLDAFGGDRPATLEARRASITDPHVLERMLYVEGGVIRSSMATGTVTIPTRGKLLTVGPHDATQPARGPSRGDTPDFSRGTALFSWTTSLTLNRAAGTADMLGDARLVHDRGDGSPRSQLDADELHATFRERPTSTQAAAGAMNAVDLVTATATGNVRLISGVRELRGERLTYDAGKALIDASSTPPRLVTLADRAGSSPVRAESLRWHLRTDRVEVTGVRPVTTPR